MCLLHARKAPYDDPKKEHSLETMTIIVRCVLSKNPAGWEAMEIMAGGVNRSDNVFMVTVFTHPRLALFVYGLLGVCRCHG
jgi:hypothetical protein